MIELKNVSKVYVSKKKQKVEALKDIDLKIGDSGLTFILGKSGSGKSTLLNILGGLDGATGGEVIVDGVSFADFTRADYNAYRNQYVGFVFQEYNLLDDFDVSGNVSLALRMSKEASDVEKVTRALGEVELSADYLQRKTAELSGGEKQRVAIARAIVKESKMILADEPTGNLDSATGETVWNILKKLSQNKPVVVVSHDRESAEKYGDRIVEISDGRIVSDSAEDTQEETVGEKFVSQKKRLPLKACIKMGANNLLKRKAKSVSVILVSIFTVFSLVLCQIVLAFSSEKTIAKFVTDNGVDYLTLDQGHLRNGNEFRNEYILRPSLLEYISANAKYIKNACIQDKQDILNMGWDFIGEALEIDDTSFYLTIDGLEKAYAHKNSCVEIDGETVKLIKERHPAEFLVGKKVDIGIFHTTEYTLAGVVDVSNCNGLARESIPDYFAKDTFPGMDSFFLEQNSDPDFIDVVMEFGDARYSGKFDCEESLPRLNGRILTADGLKSAGEITLAADEIILTYELYAELFDVSPKWSYVTTDLTEVIRVPKHIGETYKLKFYEGIGNELVFETEELKIVGISFSEEVSEWNDPRKFALGTDTYRKAANALKHGNRILVSVASIKDIEDFLVDFRDDYEGYVYDAGRKSGANYASIVYEFEHELYLFKILFSVLAGLLTLILILLVINLIYFSILNRKKEIGILSALGIGNFDITKIFLIETLIISLITFVFNLVGIICVSVAFNNIFAEYVFLSIPMLRVDIFTVLTLIGASFGLLLLAALLPVRKIVKLKPIDAIKNL